jgi:hypothetical protein
MSVSAYTKHEAVRQKKPHLALLMVLKIECFFILLLLYRNTNRLSVAAVTDKIDHFGFLMMFFVLLRMRTEVPNHVKQSCVFIFFSIT